MKRWSTTPVSKGLVTKSVIVATAVLMAVTVPLTTMQSVRADKYDDQINALQQQVNEYQAQADRLHKEADTLQNKIAELQLQKSRIQTQINLSQAQYSRLQKQIRETEQKIKDNQGALGDTIADLYVDGSISPLEMLASSKNIGDYVDKQTYQSSIRDTLTETINTIEDLKESLIGKQKEVKLVLDRQRSQRADLAAKEDERQRLLDKTKGNEAAYKSLANNAKAQMESAAAQQRAFYASLRAQSGSSGVDHGVYGNFVYTNWSGNQGCSGGYPSKYCGPQDTMGDDWALLNRECVSYAAWKIDRVYGRKVVPFNWNGTPHGYAYEWLDYAKGAWRVSDPQPGDAVVLPPMGGFAPVGHLMVVEGKSGDWIHVSQYNFYGSGEYSTMDIKASGVVFLRFPKK